jgi:hypothetical protein
MTQSFQTIIMSLAVGLATACSGSPERAFESTARQANLALLLTKPATAMLLMASDDAAVVRACRSAKDQLHALESVKVEESDLRTLDDHRRSSIEELGRWAERVISGTDESCDEASGRMIEACSVWCSSQLRGLIVHVDVLRRYAREEGVEIVSIRAQP